MKARTELSGSRDFLAAAPGFSKFNIQFSMSVNFFTIYGKKKENKNLKFFRGIAKIC